MPLRPKSPKNLQKVVSEGARETAAMRAARLFPKPRGKRPWYFANDPYTGELVRRYNPQEFPVPEGINLEPKGIAFENPRPEQQKNVLIRDILDVPGAPPIEQLQGLSVSELEDFYRKLLRESMIK